MPGTAPSAWRDSGFVAPRYKFQTQVGSEDKVATLSDADTVWTDIRHMHMREAIDKLMADFNQFLQDNAGFKGCVMPSAELITVP